MHYEINVSLASSHLFATHERSIQTEAVANKMWKLFIRKFPVSERYELKND